ncbi:MAG: NYN domain-containing protein [Rhodospirillales bacterium]
MADRAAFFIDGFNLYHAINNLKKPHLKWLNLWSLGKRLIPQHSEVLVRVAYCSAYPTHIPDKPDKMVRHREYVKALQAAGVECIMGNFKKRPKTECKSCGHTWQTHEEKESDVNLAVYLLDGAHLNEFDHAYLVTSDSDFAAVVRLFQRRFPNKKITSVAPPGRRHAGAIKEHVTDAFSLKESQLAACLFPEKVLNERGAVAAVRPEFYAPPDADDDE